VKNEIMDEVLTQATEFLQMANLDMDCLMLSDQQSTMVNDNSKPTIMELNLLHSHMGGPISDGFMVIEELSPLEEIQDFKWDPALDTLELKWEPMEEEECIMDLRSVPLVKQE
jgi:hypothetical protein